MLVSNICPVLTPTKQAQLRHWRLHTRAGCERTRLKILTDLRYPATAFLDFGRMASFTALATRNFTTFLAGILICSPVAGFRPILALRSTRTSLPRPGTMNTPFDFTSFTAVVASESKNCRLTFLLTLQASASLVTNCVCVIT